MPPSQRVGGPQPFRGLPSKLPKYGCWQRVERGLLRVRPLLLQAQLAGIGEEALAEGAHYSGASEKLHSAWWPMVGGLVQSGGVGRKREAG